MTRCGAIGGVGIVAFAVAVAACGGGRCPEGTTRAPAEGAAEASGPLAGYGWMSGTWVADGDEGVRTEERWAVPRGTILPGTSRSDGADGVTRAWESLRIEQVGEVVRYVARPSGAAEETAFVAVELEPGRAVFESPEHDYPQRITYSLEGPGLLRATISDLHGGNAQSWSMQRVGP